MRSAIESSVRENRQLTAARERAYKEEERLGAKAQNLETMMGAPSFKSIEDRLDRMLPQTYKLTAETLY